MSFTHVPYFLDNCSSRLSFAATYTASVSSHVCEEIGIPLLYSMGQIPSHFVCRNLCPSTANSGSRSTILLPDTLPPVNHTATSVTTMPMAVIVYPNILAELETTGLPYLSILILLAHFLWTVIFYCHPDRS